ncbi:N-acetylglucosamine-6-phosphate deacetylase [Peptostreptococcus anaerobius]|uniref:N-acetylglucosamine-6-phosphate deacetylase n=1 Tax=Peptostreptococcus anaerobius TaxID=1261 RepID=UPI002902E5DD|nr:N-acetylglucosamine-6-phosphate deacetylase [Peptostreptococcus anaerobius]MDU1599347.1 N-acetylglucosamine-6-phosphate deacetylase [Peptostreptococcus anaerobius]MDU1682915.1 N-acetylglucosamine-6-phosphate deacetylase [Peptostreptococcus anaerobius]
MILKAKYIVLKDRMLEDSAILIEDKKIKKILSSDELEGKEVIDYKDSIICPGFVDTHVHGFCGHDFMDKSDEGLRSICRDILKAGVTSILPTTLTASEDDIMEVVRIVKDNKDAYGAKIQGIFLEGPFFTEKHKGAQNPSYFLKPEIEKLRKWQEIAGGMIKKVALAPELEGSEEFVQKAREMGIYVALGHSDASYDEAKSAVDAGANIFVHTYNGMSGLHHRNPGMVGAAMTLEDVFAELICDGHHVHPVAADVLIRSRGYESVALISDCMMAGGMPVGKYKLGDYDVVLDGETVRLKEGNLAGSVLKMRDAVKNLVKWGIASPFEAIQMGTQVPAKSVGIDDVCGVIEEGRAADILVLDDEFSIVDVYLNGEKVDFGKEN